MQLEIAALTLSPDLVVVMLCGVGLIIAVTALLYPLLKYHGDRAIDWLLRMAMVAHRTLLSFVKLLLASAIQRVHAAQPTNERGEPVGSLDHVLFKVGVLAIAWTVLTAADIDIVVARISAWFGETGANMSATGLGLIAAASFASALIVYGLLLGDGLHGPRIFFGNADDSQLASLRRMMKVGLTLTFIATALLAFVAYEASVVTSGDVITPALFWLAFTLAMAGGILLGGYALEHALGLVVALMLVLFVVPVLLLWAIVWLVWSLCAGPLYLIRFLFVDVLGHLCFFLWRLVGLPYPDPSTGGPPQLPPFGSSRLPQPPPSPESPRTAAGPGASAAPAVHYSVRHTVSVANMPAVAQPDVRPQSRFE
jgi:hypothetical protein